MKTLSNAELKEAITTTIMTYPKAHEDVQSFMLSHLQALLLEQRVRATQSVSIEPIESTIDRVEFDARVKAQDGPEWVEWGGGECPVEPGEDTEVEFRGGQTRRDEYPEGRRWDHKNRRLDIMRYRTWEQSK